MRQREYLERNLATIRAKLKKDSEIHRHENLRVLQDNTQLLQEINNLRRELKTSRTHAHSLETELGLRKTRGHHCNGHLFRVHVKTSDLVSDCRIMILEPVDP